MPDLRDLVPAGVEPGHLNDFFQSNLPLVRVPPAGTWRVRGSAVQELVAIGEADPARLVTRYLAAFGPATVRDAQVWSGLTRLKPVFERSSSRSSSGGYYDLPGAPRPAADVPAPARFLPRWDNL